MPHKPWDRFPRHLLEIDTSARDLKPTFFIVGATARDILLQHAHGIHTTRATLDVGIGVSVSNWEQFRTLKEALVHTAKFSPTWQTQRLRFDDELLLDIFPFGGIAEEVHSIAWLPEYDTELSVAGFQEFYQHAVSVLVRTDPDLVVKVDCEIILLFDKILIEIYAQRKETAFNSISKKWRRANLVLST